MAGERVSSQTLFAMLVLVDKWGHVAQFFCCNLQFTDNRQTNPMV